MIDSILHDSFEMIDAAGNRSTKEKELAGVASTPWDPGTFEYRIERLRIYDDRWAIVDGRGVASAYTHMS